MPDEPEPQASPPLQVSELPHHRSEDYFSTYANASGVAVSFYDLRIIFGEITPSEDSPQRAYIRDKAEVIVTWEHAKALAATLEQIIGNYEKANGPIRKLV